MVGVPRFELGASSSRTKRATGLRHTPTKPVPLGAALIVRGAPDAGKACPCKLASLYCGQEAGCADSGGSSSSPGPGAG